MFVFSIFQLEKKNLTFDDKVKLSIWTSNKSAISNVRGYVIQANNLPDLEMSDAESLETAIRVNGLEQIYRSQTHRMSTHFSKQFLSTVSKKYPISNEAAYRKNVQPVDDNALLPLSKRQAGHMLELDISGKPDPTLTVNDIRIGYYVRVSSHLKFVQLDDVYLGNNEYKIKSGLM